MVCYEFQNLSWDMTNEHYNLSVGQQKQQTATQNSRVSKKTLCIELRTLIHFYQTTTEINEFLH